MMIEKALDILRHRFGYDAFRMNQEAAIQSLLISTVNKISHPILNQMRRLYETSEPEPMELPKDPFGLEE